MAGTIKSKIKSRSPLPWRSASLGSGHHHHRPQAAGSGAAGGATAGHSTTTHSSYRSSSVKEPPHSEQQWKTIIASAAAQFDKQWSSSKSKSKGSLDDFKLIRTVGVGSFARVILARHEKDLQYYAIKVLNKAKVFVDYGRHKRPETEVFRGDLTKVAIVRKENVKQVLREKKILQAASFPFIASLTYTFKDNANLYMALEYVNGGELFSYMRRTGKLSESSSRFYIAQLVLVLEYLHNVDVLYRDLKPENLLVDSDGYLKLVDFGFAKRTRNRTYTMCGTPEYLAPEIIRAKGYGRSVDWWALGVLLYEMNAGCTPFKADEESKLYAQIIVGKFICPAHMSPQLQILLCGLLQPELTRRLGCLRSGVADIKQHPWFSDTDWMAVYSRKVPAPFKPDCGTAPSDSSNFAKFSDEDIVVGSTNEYASLFADF